MITNPILKGFNPDPSICRVGNDYYIATSTFEWFPGVQIHHSKDLVNWELIKRPLERTSQLNMLGNEDSSGIWAPCLSYADDKFWLVFTDVKHTEGPYKDCPNYIVTCDTIDGDWSEPIYINSSGFDPSLFHDGDGKKYFINMIWDHRVEFPSPVKNRFYGIVGQEYDPITEKLIGDVKYLTAGTNIGLVEGAHLYKRNGYYYLMVAEGGTMYEHAESVFRSESIFGDYIEHPSNPILTSYLDPTNPIQKAGHASMQPYKEDIWVLAHLCGRPLTLDRGIHTADRGDCPLGRETALQFVEWKNDWPYVIDGPSPTLKHDIKVGFIDAKNVMIDDFDQDDYNINFQTLRIKLDEDICNLKERKGYLRLRGMNSLGSKFIQSHVSRRWQSFYFEAETKVEFTPTSFQQSAGLSCYYNTMNHTNIGVTHCDKIGRCIEIVEIKQNVYSTNGISKIKISDEIRAVYFKVIVNKEFYHYEYSLNGIDFIKINHDFYSGNLSDDCIARQQDAFFTGAFVGMYCYDMTGNKLEADFDYFKYEEK